MSSLESFSVILLSLCIGVVGFAYVGYPILIWLLSRCFGRDPVPPAVESADLPTVSLLIAAHNEEADIAARIENALGLHYPPDKLEIVIASDGSTDATEEIVERYSDRGVRLLAYRNNGGKSAVLNASVPRLRGDVVVLSDANTRMAPDSLRRLATWFADPAVGVVCGRLILTDAVSGRNADGMYWKYENFLKGCEGRLGALIGCNGAIYAIRRRLFPAVRPGTIIDDFVIPMDARRESGCRILYDAACGRVGGNTAGHRLRISTPGPDRGRRVSKHRPSMAAVEPGPWLGEPHVFWTQGPSLAVAVLPGRHARVELSPPRDSRLRFDANWSTRFLRGGDCGGVRAAAAAGAAGSSIEHHVRYDEPGPFGRIFPLGIRRTARHLEADDSRSGGGSAKLLMDPWLLAAGGTALAAAVGGVAVGRSVRRRGLDRWLIPYLLSKGSRRSPRPGESIHLLLCIADHFEPKLGGAATAPGSLHACADGSRSTPSSSPSSATPTAGRRGIPSSFRRRSTSPSIWTRWRSYAAQDSARSRSTCTTTTTPPKICGERSTTSSDMLADRHGLSGARPRHGRGALRLHPWQLGAGQLAAGRPLVRREQRAGHLARDRLLCGHDSAVGPDPTQTRRSTGSTTPRVGPAGAESHDTGIDVGPAPSPGPRADAHPGPALSRLGRAEVGAVAAGRERLPARQSAAAGTHGSRTWLAARVQVPTRPTGSSSNCTRTGPTRETCRYCSASRWCVFHRYLRGAGRRPTRTSTTTT